MAPGLTSGPRVPGGLQPSPSAPVLTRGEPETSPKPKPPERALWRTTTRPTPDIVGAATVPSQFIGAPRLTGASQPHARHWRCDIQMSRLPRPPARVETKSSVCASDERSAFASTALELISGPRLTGSDHSAVAKRSARSRGATECD